MSDGHAVAESLYVQTDRGLMTPAQILEEVEYGMFKRNRDMGIALHRLECLWGTTRLEAWEARYVAERRAA